MRIEQPLKEQKSPAFPHRVARISTFTFSFVASALLFGGIYGLIAFSPGYAWIALAAAVVLSFLAFIQIANRIADRFPPKITRIIRWIHALSFEGFAICATALLHPSRYLVSHRTGSTRGRPILLVHGYLHDSSAWIYHKRKLVKDGFGPIYTLNLGHPFRSIRRYAEKVKHKAEQIERETNRSDLILIGHSMGGLVCSLYATRLAPARTVTDVITIGSPLAGTHMAKLGLGPDAREMERDSVLLKELQEEIKNCSHTRFYHIATKTDQLVIPHTSALVGDHLERQFLIEDIGHVTLLFSPRVARVIKEWLYSETT